MNLKVIIVYINAFLIAINWFIELITIRPIVIFFLSRGETKENL